MNLNQGKRIRFEFCKAIAEKTGLIVTKSTIGRTTIEVTKPTSCLLCLHASSHSPLRWGVTANILNLLRKQSKPWAVVLLGPDSGSGWLLSSQEVEHYTEEVWPLANDGDYKPSPGSYLANSEPFRSIDQFVEQLEHLTSNFN